MTGNLAQLTIDLVDWFLLRGDPTFATRRRRQAVGQRLVRFGVPMLSFVVGSLLGACLTRRFGLLSVALPVLVLGGLTFVAWHEKDGPRSAPARLTRGQAASGSPFPRPELASRPEL